MSSTLDFNTMLDEAYDLIDNKDGKGKLVFPKMDIEIETTRLHWKNIKEYLKIMNRSPDHLLKYLQNEIPDKKINWYSSKISDGLLFLGKFKKNYNITDLIYKYIETNVSCSSCKSIKTIITKDEFICNNCGFHKYLL